MTEVTTLIVAFCGGVVAIAAFVGVVWWLIKPRLQDWAEAQIIKPVRETHHQVAENHHSSSDPTILDRLDEVDRRVGSVQTNMTALTLVLDEHLRWSRTREVQRES